MQSKPNALHKLQHKEKIPVFILLIYSILHVALNECGLY